jgi:hypothetical protein
MSNQNRRSSILKKKGPSMLRPHSSKEITQAKIFKRLNCHLSDRLAG